MNDCFPGPAIVTTSLEQRSSEVESAIVAERERCAKIAENMPIKELRQFGRGELRVLSGKVVRERIVKAIRATEKTG